MADKTGISWTDATWNPIRGCSRVSEGCRNCYAETVAARFCDQGAPYHGFAERGRTGSKWTGKVELIPNMLDQPLRWKRPRRIFVNSMSDLFHDALDVWEIAEVFAIAVAATHLRGHTLQILTKRPHRMCRLLNRESFWREVNAGARRHTGCDPLPEYSPSQPPPGILIGISAENQEAFDERWPNLRDTPAALRFVSAEPLIGAIDMETAWPDWVIAGGESGPNARPMHPDWARGLRDQCQAGGVPFFFKQRGEWTWVDDADYDAARIPAGAIGFKFPDDEPMWRVGKKAAGALLDGRAWEEFPA
jgi:protein gp37